MDTPYAIHKYDINLLCSYISYKTKTPFHLVKQKPQITYIDNYLKYFSKKEKHLIFENEYIDQHYLEDYAEYYVRCFNDYNKYASRIHFFEADKNFKDDFLQVLSGDINLINNYKYLGFIVIRPIPQTFLARVCFKSYNEDYMHLINKVYDVSLFGIKLKVETIAYQEQDRILSACATSALWSFYHAHPHMNNAHLPSPSIITKNAYPIENGYDREFPNSGLTTEMICRSIRSNGLVPIYFDFSKEPNLLKEYIFAYSRYSNLPIILGVEVRSEDNNEIKGLHAITILGYSMSQSNFENKLNNFKLKSHNIDKIYVHDDRIGSFVKIYIGNECYKVFIKENNEVTETTFEKEIYCPGNFIIGVYHKIRIPYIKIKETCNDMMVLLSNFLKEHEYNNAYEIIKNFLWEIALINNSDLKKQILESNIECKQKYLTASWPKYIWSAQISYKGNKIVNLLFDATDLNQGHVFIDMLPLEPTYSDYFIRLCDLYFKKKFNSLIKKDKLYKTPNNYLWGIIDYFKQKENFSENLIKLFGKLNIPKYLHSKELNKDNVVDKNIIRITHINDIRNEKFKPDKKLNDDTQYIWVIDADGFLCIGKENKNNKMGHPTLTGGMPARIGGELKYSNKDENWILTPFSGRYSGDYSNEDKREYLNNVTQVSHLKNNKF